MILLTRLGGPVFALNPDLVERADCTPDTVITLVDGKKYVVAESLPEVIALIRQFRATVVADAQCLSQQPHGNRSDRPKGERFHAERPHGERSNVERLSPDRRQSDPAEADYPPDPAQGSGNNVVPIHRRER